ncbi:MAG: ParB/RepB/Spo0J family partition protein [Oscillospiraceae bacterium]|nr:ParB/RepB/Spo0J family partition protein [Oscillospiraceae bacterium]
MQFLSRHSRATRGTIAYLPVDDIHSSAVQPRQNFSPSQLEELAASIGEYGVLNPLTVRQRTEGYELVAGERRLRAAKLAGLLEVPCIVMELNMEEASLIALVENLQRRDLDFIEEARGIAQLIRLFGMSQEECARRLGKSQSAVANKLRLLRLPDDVLQGLCNAGLTERHGRALLRLNTPQEQRDALAYIISRDLTVAATDAYVERLLEAQAAPDPEKQKTFILKDVRVFLNTLSHSLDMMKQGGIDAGMQRQETEDALILTINIPKTKKQQPVTV